MFRRSEAGRAPVRVPPARGASASIGDAEGDREDAGARRAHSGLGAATPEAATVSPPPKTGVVRFCFASGLVAGEPPNTPHAGREPGDFGDVVVVVVVVVVVSGGVTLSAAFFFALPPRVRSSARGASPSSGKSNGSQSRRPRAGTSTSSSSSSSSSVNASTSAKVTRRRFPGVGRNGSAAAPAAPRPRGPSGVSRGDGTASRAAPNVPADPGDDADAVPEDREAFVPGLFWFEGDGDPPRDAGFGFGFPLGGDRVAGETGGSSTAASREVSKSNGSGLDLARLLDVGLGFGCGSRGAADAGPLASRAGRNTRAAGEEDPGVSESEPPRVAPVPLPETSPAPFMNPRMPAWRCAFPLRS